MNSISPNLNLMIKSCEKVSKILIRDYGEVEKLQVSIKGLKNYVTNSDRKVEDMLLKELSKSKKKYSFLTEESGFIKNEDTENFWVIDPIDGTTNFLHGVPHFAISIALKSGDEIVSGLIYDPLKDEMFYAEKENGAFFNNQRIRVSKKKELNSCLFATGGQSKNEINLPIRKTGSAALDIAYVAAGRYDGYFQKNVKLWDIASGLVIVKEAGGQVNDFDLNKVNDINIIASSTSISEKLQENLINF